jgi:hypothetical protein
LYLFIYYANNNSRMTIATISRRRLCSVALRQVRACLAIALLCAGTSRGQEVALRIVGVDGTTHELALTQWQTLPRVSVKAVDHGGPEVTFEACLPENC